MGLLRDDHGKRSKTFRPLFHFHRLLLMVLGSKIIEITAETLRTFTKIPKEILIKSFLFVQRTASTFQQELLNLS